ncbi:MAG: SDR family oxidoreductase [Actinomycetales bacterium]
MADLSSLASVASAATRLLATDVVPDALVLNAGVQVVNGVRYSPDGYELTMATNVLGHFLLYRALRPLLRPGARIITLASQTHRGGLRAWGFPAARWSTPEELFRPQHPAMTARAGRVRYATSKLASIYLAYEIDRRDRPAGIRATAFDPALMPETGLARDYPPAVRALYRRLCAPIARMPGAASVSTSAADLAWLAASPDAVAVAGRYVSGRTDRPSSALSYDQANARALWDYCLHQTDNWMGIT